MRLIDADELIEAIEDLKKRNPAKDLADRLTHVLLDGTIMAINDAPTVEPKKGEWVQDESNGDYDVYTCTACEGEWISLDGTPVENGMNFCPFCGADMGTGRRENEW